MSRKVTPEERNILLENPELVMFDPFITFRTHRCSLGKALILPVITAALIVLWGYLCPGFMNLHLKLFAGIGCAAIVIASGSLPVLYFIIDDREFKKAKAENFAKQLRMLMPEELECNIAHIQWVVAEKAEGGWVMDGREGMFGYCSFVNYFRIEPDTDLAVITGSRGFLAFVKRDPRTESFYI